MKKETENLLNEIFESRKANGQRNEVANIPAGVGDLLVFDSTSIKPEKSDFRGKTYKRLDFISKNGITLSEKHFITNNNGLQFIATDYNGRLREFVDKVENGITLRIAEIKCVPNPFSDEGRTKYYRYEVVNEATEATEE